MPRPIRSRHGTVGPHTASAAHLLCMDATTQITPTFLTQRELSELLRMPERTLEDWRLMQTGPPYIKLGRLVRYDVQDVLTWVREHRHG
ncbi:putative DNA-binding transcriptional regulator AlpA [Cryobacterium sp. CAN_C3]|nr:putative DNA-binding transcriptional regulator AlpA [Cryobacterium sp. CAN_C3]